MNKTKHTHIPELRFPEFKNDGDWEEQTLDNLAKYRRGSFPQPYGLPEWYDEINGLPFVQVYDVDENLKLKTTTKNKISEIATKQSVFIPKGTIIITLQGSIGRVAITQYDAYIDRTLLLFEKFNKPIDKVYFAYTLQLLFNIEKQKAPGGIIKTITKEVLSGFIVNLPQLKEQQKIAACLSSLDDLIEGHSQKLELLEEHKKGLLQNLFPQKGKKQPAYRFPEFKNDGDWEEKTLGEVSTYVNGKAHEKDITDTGKYVVVNSKFISSDGDVIKHSNSAYCRAKERDILMVLSDVPNGKAIAKCFYVSKDDTYTVNQRICKLTSKNIDGIFLFYVLNRNPYFLAFDDGVKQTNLTKSNVLACPILKPKNKKEQQKIATCLSSLDELIKEQKQKIEQLKQHKKGLMQKLFVQ